MKKIITLVCLIAIGPLSGAEEKEVPLQEALQYAASNANELIRYSYDGYPKRAMHTLLQHPAETAEFVIKILSKGGKSDLPNPQVLIGLIAKDSRREVKMRIVATYDFGDIKTPFLQEMAGEGVEENMPIIRAVIEKNPDAQLSGILVGQLLQSYTAAAYATVYELRRNVPGKWQESDNVKYAFRRLYAGMRVEGMLGPYADKLENPPPDLPPFPPGFTPPVLNSKSPAPVIPRKPDTDQQSSATSSSIAKHDRTSADLKSVVLSEQATNYWPWGVGGALLLALLVFLLNKSK